MSERRVIPFVRPARVGNYKIWRSKVIAGKGKDKLAIEQVCISDLEGVWQVKIPATSDMFAAISEMYADEKMVSALSTIVTNMLGVTSVTNGYFHRAVQMITAVYFNPDLLRDKKQRKPFVKEAEALVKDFLEWRKAYEENERKNAPTEEDERNEEVLEEMLEEIDKE